MSRFITTLVVLGIAACGTDRAAFRPTTNVTGAGPGGQAAASYEIRAPNAEAHARVNVWSRGAWIEDGLTYARVGLEVRNTGDQVLSLDPSSLQLDAYIEDGQQLPSAQLVRTTAPGATLQVPPGEASTIQLVFAMNARVDPDDIGNLRLRWAIDHQDGQRYVQFTDFRRVRDYVATGYGAAYYDPIYGMYDPFLYGPPFGYYHRYSVPVGRVIIQERARPPRTVIRDR